MRSLRWIGLMSSLLIVGVLGGLMAPLLSDAGTSLTFQVDSGAVATILNVVSGAASTCTIPAGYTACFALPTTGGPYSGTGPAGFQRSFTIKGYGGSLPRLLVTDGSGLDNITLTTVEFAPVGTAPVTWGSTNANIGVPGTTNYGEKHTLKVVVTHKFDKVANPKTVGTSARYQFALRTSGMFKGGGQTGATASGDFVQFVGDGIFGSTSTTTPLLGPVPAGAPACNTFNSLATPLNVNYCPLKRTMGVTTALTSSFSTNPALQQVVTYPSYVCSNGTNCTPTVILKTTATINGPDSFILSSSNDAAGGSCSLDAPGPPSSTAAVPCHDSKKGKKSLDSLISGYFATQARADAAAFAAEGAESTPACEGEECVCQDPDTCTTDSTITINKTLTDANCGGLEQPPCSHQTFSFHITGPTTTTASVETDNHGVGSTNVPVNAGGPYSVTEDPNPDSGWAENSGSSSCNDGDPTNFTVSAGDDNSCHFFNSPIGDGEGVS